MVHLSLSCVFLDVCLEFLASKQVSCTLHMSALWQICQGLRVEQVELERTAALFDITCEMQARLAKLGSNGRLTVPETETEKLSGGQYP